MLIKSDDGDWEETKIGFVLHSEDGRIVSVHRYKSDWFVSGWGGYELNEDLMERRYPSWLPDTFRNDVPERNVRKASPWERQSFPYTYENLQQHTDAEPIEVPPQVQTAEPAPANTQHRKKERIFISYKRVDSDPVFAIKRIIEKETNLECWIDLEGIESDAQFMNVIIRAINNCEVVLFMYSNAHTKITDFESDWTIRELNFAKKKQKRIVFINIDGTPLSDVFEFSYSTKQQVDGRSSKAIARLCSDLRTWLNVPAQPTDADAADSTAEDDKE